MTAHDVTLVDKYTRTSGRVFISGIQALVRLPTEQVRRDRAAGLKTGGFISGYRGSPLGAFDNELWRNQALLKEYDVTFQPGLNEDLAATAVWGSQQTQLFGTATGDGAFGIWYGKGPGVDRTVDVLKHANMAGTSKHGGVLAIAGDDHGCQSSTLPHQSEQVFEACLMPILNPATVQEYLDFGLYGIALSRFSGCWVGFKAIAETVESAVSIKIDPSRPNIIIPTDFEMPPGGLHIRWPDPPLEAERRLHGPKLQAVAAFVRANGIDRMVIAPREARLGIITTGKAYLDVRQAFEDLGLDERAVAALGIRIYKLGLTWPIEREGALHFADGLADVLVVEEKRGFIERQLVQLLYNMPADRRPSIVGKTDERGMPLIGSEGEITPTVVAKAIVSRLARFDAVTDNMRQRVARLESFEAVTSGTSLNRTPFFCSGCPHNTSTNVPEGSRAGAGIGCHGMAIFMPQRRTTTNTQMGGEGVNWIGQTPFVSDKHVFQNLGDGTYTHSGSIALRAAAAAGVNITYKILYNDAVAMTGGQPAEGGLTVPQIAHQAAAEGAKIVAVVSDEPDKYPSPAIFPPGTLIHHRDDLDALQRRLRDTPGLTVLIYDQTCAAEKRRRRKRGEFPDPAMRVFINHEVCEGCGDCSVKSNCISVKPLDTALGRKRQIDQSSCNKDFSCLNGFCPSFVTVRGGRIRKAVKPKVVAGEGTVADVPMPDVPAMTQPYDILVTGIGGTGVLTVGALLGMAAHIDGKGASVLDFTGMAQKNGAVMSHVRLAPTPADLNAVRIGAGGADLLLGCDLVVSAGAGALSRLERDVTRAVVNTNEQPTAEFIARPDLEFGGATMRKAILNAVGERNTSFVDATRYATALLGDSIASNLFMLGFAFQKGFVPLSFEAIDGAIKLNNVSVEMNRRTFALGRLAAHDPAAIAGMVQPKAVAATADVDRSGLAWIVDDRARRLTDYQNAAYAARYRAIVEKAAVSAKSIGSDDAFAKAVARNLYKLMAYKDEYEVARLYADVGFKQRLEAQFEGEYTLEFNLAPPLIATRDANTGHLKKRAFGPWMLKAFGVLAKFKRLRNTPLDIFGYTAERRMERALIGEYEARIETLIAALSSANYATAVKIADLPDDIRGYGHIKERALEATKAKEAALLQEFAAAGSSSQSLAA